MEEEEEKQVQIVFTRGRFDTKEERERERGKEETLAFPDLLSHLQLLLNVSLSCLPPSLPDSPAGNGIFHPSFLLIFFTNIFCGTLTSDAAQ